MVDQEKIFGERMNTAPHFVLFSGIGEQSSQHDMHGGSWHFRLKSSGGDSLEASDTEVNASRARLELLAVVRGLEALEGPSTVTLVTTNRQVSRAIRQGLDYWRARDWKWERFGEKVPMNNADLWKRIDRAMQIHDVQCRLIRVDQAHPNHVRTAAVGERRVKKRKRRSTSVLTRPLAAVTRWTADSLHGVANTLQRFVPEHAPNPHPMM